MVPGPWSGPPRWRIRWDHRVVGAVRLHPFLLVPEDTARLSFQDVAEALAVHELLDRGVPHPEIRSAIETLRADFGAWPLQLAPIATTAKKVAGAHIVRKNGAQAWELGRKRGQGVLSFVDLEEINQLLRRGGWALKELPAGVTHIEVDPDRLSGRPTIKARRVPAEKVAGWQCCQVAARF